MAGLFNYPGRWEGYLASPLTPFDADGKLDIETYEKQVEFLVASGAPALCSLMHSGEPLTMSTGERELIAAHTVKAAAGRVPTIAHVSCAGTDATIGLARQAEQAGAHGVVVLAPYHLRPTPDALLAHFAAVGDAISGSLVAYNHPGGSQVEVTPDLLVRMIDRIPNLHALKEASHDYIRFPALKFVVDEYRPDISLLMGLEYLLQNRVSGGAGSMSVCAVIVPRLVNSLWQAVQRGDYAEATVLQDRMSRFLNIILPRYSAALKAAAQMLGRDMGQTRLPTLPLSDDERNDLARKLEAIGVFETEPYGWDADAAPDPDRARAAIATP